MDAPWDTSYMEIFGILNKVQCVEVRYETIRDGFAGFLRSAARRAEIHEYGLALPSVRMLIIDEAEFFDQHFNDICVFLSHRKDRKQPLSYLGLYYCKFIDAEKLSTLEGLVNSLGVINDDVKDELGNAMDIPSPASDSDDYEY